MDTLMILSICVFGLGAALCTFFMVFLAHGKRIPGDTGERQIVKYRDLELQTNSIMLFLIVSAFVAVAPMWLQVKLKMQPPPPPQPEATIFLSGELRDSSDSTTKLSNTPLTATNPQTKQTLTAQTDQEGHFDFDAIRITPEANRIKLVIKREGYSPLEKVIVANEQNIPVTLSKINQ